MRLENTIKDIQIAHKEDPNIEVENGITYPAEYLYGERCAKWLKVLKPDADELQTIAAYCQHLKRFEIPRSNYPMNKPGYYEWITGLYTYQAEQAGKIMAKNGYSEVEIEVVKKMVAKQDLRNDANSQLIEDIACLVFLEYYIQPFAAGKDYSEEKWIRIIQKTWKKMSDQAHEKALKINYNEGILELIQKALQAK